MEYKFSQRISSIRPSAVGNILKQMNDPSLISFAGGNPSADSFPVTEIREMSKKLLEDDPIGTLQYSLSEGYPPLVQCATDFFNRQETIVSENDSLLITSGSSQIMEFATKIFCNEGDVVLCENPSFMVSLDAMRSNGALLIGIPLDEDGINLTQLERHMAARPTPKLIYLIPNFQNPTGITMSLKKRKAVYELAVKYGVMILEDDPYGELRFTGERIPSIKSLDREGVVIYAASLSKIISPGMRVACAIAPRPVYDKLKTAKSLNDIHNNVWSQRICERILATSDMSAQIKRLSHIYGEKFTLAYEEMKKTFHPSVSYTHPDGGMFIWITLPEEVDMPDFVSAALKQKVALVPGNVFYVDSTLPCSSFRLSFSTPPKEDIIKGIHILGELTYRFCR